ncbi:MAG: DUF1549 domain-containing protein [Planctomycetaceae bacterium]|nr:DUF1549 domain-containing protein [Planctomycetaceae bacterium]
MRIGSGLLLCALLGQRTLPAAEPVDYARQVKPLLTKRCYACHGALKSQAGLRLDTAASALKGGDGGPAVEPGQAAESLLIKAITGVDGVRQMPPPGEGERLSVEEVAIVRAWVDQGAAAPADEQPQPDPRTHWAFQRVERPAIPQVHDPAWVRNPIDAFVAAKHERQGLRPTTPAAKGALLRRVSLDLIGLPPTRDELHAFQSDMDEDAYERVVDRLLDSPQYGERWARHWMDVWRYSDWYGRRAVPDVWNSAPQVWRWRDWIVNSLNADKGYDRMVIEMLAADEIAPDDEEAAVATGYIIRNWYALNSHQWMKDMVEHTGKAFLGLTFNCAHCHDHKYDPITQEEYFRLRAVFEPIQVRQDRRPGEPDPGPFQKYEYTILRKVQPLGAVRIFDENFAAETFMYRMGDERDRFADKPPVTPGAPAFLGGDKLAISPVALPPTSYYPGLKPFIKESETAARQATLQAAKAELNNAQQSLVARLARLTEIETQQLAALQTAPAQGTQPPPVDPKLLDRQGSAQAALRPARHAVEVASAHLATEQALAVSLASRIAADIARYCGPVGDPETLARTASRAERMAALRVAEEKRLVAAYAAESARLTTAATPAGAAKDQAAAAQKSTDDQLIAAVQAVDASNQALVAEAATYTPLSPVYPATSTGRRKALAEWIARRDNPLTARVAVNHIWGRHFGKALVETVYDLGINGKRPSHPELLDWLAAELMEPTLVTPPPGAPPLSKGGQGGSGELVSDASSARDATPPNPPFLRGGEEGVLRGGEDAGSWRMKHLHRLIVTSNTYRQGSSAGVTSTGNLAADPDNRWLWRFTPRRVESEVLRDSLLFAAGQLDLKLGGQPFENTEELTSRRRSLYFSVYPEDGGHPKFLELFDAPDPCDCYKRSDSMIPQQALALTNSRLTLNFSRLLGQKLWDEAAALDTGDEARQTAFITGAFERILSRGPTAVEAAACREFLQRQADLFRAEAKDTATAAAAAQGAVAASNEPLIRAGESLIHVLFNHNDFVSIR